MPRRWTSRVLYPGPPQTQALAKTSLFDLKLRRKSDFIARTLTLQSLRPKNGDYDRLFPSLSTPGEEWSDEGVKRVGSLPLLVGKRGGCPYYTPISLNRRGLS